MHTALIRAISNLFLAFVLRSYKKMIPNLLVGNMRHRDARRLVQKRSKENITPSPNHPNNLKLCNIYPKLVHKGSIKSDGQHA